MYGEVPGSAVVPVVSTLGVATVLPTTGADGVVTIASALAAGLLTWGVVYYYKVVRA